MGRPSKYPEAAVSFAKESRRKKPRSVAMELPHDGRLRLRNPLADVRQHRLLGLLLRDRRGEHLVGQAEGGVHLPDDVRHPLELLGGGPDDHVDPLAEDLQVEVGHQRGDLDEQTTGQVQPVISRSI